MTEKHKFLRHRPMLPKHKAVVQSIQRLKYSQQEALEFLQADL